MKESLFSLLSEYSKKNILPMHMPGHKRNESSSFLQSVGARYDITEIHGFDNLHEPEGTLLDGMKYAASLWGSRESFYLVGGSSCGVLAAIYTVVQHGDRVLMARNCHKSVYNAVELCALSPVYIMPEYNDEFGVNGSVSPSAVRMQLEKNSDVSLVIITSPTYEGVISDIAEIARICHERNVPLMVDEAHGAHLSLFGKFPSGAVECGADIVVQSLHKTMSSLTQTAILHACSERIDTSELRRSLMIFESTSPSYLLLLSIDECVRSVTEKDMEEWLERLSYVKNELSGLKKLKLLSLDEKHENIFKLDPSKILISTANAAITGCELAELLRDKYKIEFEMFYDGYALAMTGQGDRADDMERFCGAISEIDSEVDFESKNQIAQSLLPERACGVYAAVRAKSEITDAKQACGKISCEYVYAYPPGIPIIVPGELISSETIEYLFQLKDSGVALKSMTNDAPNKFKTIFYA